MDFLGKNTDGYRRYIKHIPKLMRQKEVGHPVTPNIHWRCSKRRFDELVKKWRKQLHDWDNPSNMLNDTESRGMSSRRESLGGEMEDGEKEGRDGSGGGDDGGDGGDDGRREGKRGEMMGDNDDNISNVSTDKDGYLRW
jgi:hypothetical protein